MSELKVYVMPIKTNIFGQTIVGLAYYSKSEADKVIAHNKFKRCLAMAKMCKSEADAAFLRYNWDSGRYADVDFYEKWSEIWLALAEEPTWAKFLQLIRKEGK